LRKRISAPNFLKSSSTVENERKRQISFRPGSRRLKVGRFISDITFSRRLSGATIYSGMLMLGCMAMRSAMRSNRSAEGPTHDKVRPKWTFIRPFGTRRDNFYNPEEGPWLVSCPPRCALLLLRGRATRAFFPCIRCDALWRGPRRLEFDLPEFLANRCEHS
jgi:hypothetical protein